MSAIAFLTFCTIIIGSLIGLFFWLTEGGGSLEKLRSRIAPAILAIRSVTRFFATSYREAAEQRKAAQQRRQPAPKPKFNAASSSSRLPELDGRLRGPGNFDFHIVGESHYQGALRRIAKTEGRGDDGDGLLAYVVTEPDNPHDPNACAVYIGDQKVGYLSRDDAENYVSQMKRHGIAGISCFETKAKLIGGYGEKKHFGVMLDLPVDD
ncbi:HIRAN domain-containing protein [Metapseudomonas sp. CR1201]